VRIGAVLLLGLGAAAILFSGSAMAADAWLVGFLAWIGIAAGALGALAVGHLLREDWIAPVRAPLEAAARTLPLLALAAIPVLAAPELLYPWAGPAPPPMPAARAAWLSPWPFRLRGTAILALWVALAWVLTRPGMPRKPLSALVLALLAITVPIAAQDWAFSRDPTWHGSLQGFAAWVEGVTSALAAAALVALLRREMPSGDTGPGEATERALLALGLATLWLWFIQFIVVWMADLPEEAGWYLRRMEGAWPLAKLGIAVPALLLALVLAAPPRHRRWRMGMVCALLLVSHLAHLWWVVRPDAPLAMPPAWADAAALVAIGLAWWLWWRAGLRDSPANSRASAAASPRAVTATPS
jgi:hypothetical protein